jgi:hypothetical protein
MSIRICDGGLFLVQLRTRMPFRYGIATMTNVPQAFVRLRLEVNGRPAVGIAADLLPPKWFTKVPAKPLDEEVSELLGVIRHALSIASGLRGKSAFEVWWQIHAAQSEWGRAHGLPALLTHFGTSLVERALIEAVCRNAGRSFAGMLHANELGVDLGVIHGELRGRAPREFLPGWPLERILLRHTVGLADPLTEADIRPEERLDDGLPQALNACIRRYGLRHFKIKLSGELPQDLARLHRIKAIVQENAPRDYRVTLDGNEQFKSVEQFREYWEALVARRELRELIARLLFVEQPLHREVALEAQVGEALQLWQTKPPLIIDESDAAFRDLATALRLGYAGTSHKNCKGLFKGVAHAGLLRHLQEQRPGRQLVLSGEDLCNIGPVALLQDLAVMAALGIRSVERNGHHYHAGLSQFPPAVQREMLNHHSDLYHHSRDGWPTLRIVNGEIDLHSINRAPLGVGFVLDVEQFPPVN